MPILGVVVPRSVAFWLCPAPFFAALFPTCVCPILTKTHIANLLQKSLIFLIF
jgi:hypothetical protein